MDVLTDLIDTLRLRGTAYCRTELTAPWGIELPPSAVAHFHVVQEGSCWIQLADESAGTRLNAGDLVVIPHGRGHRLVDDPRNATVALGDLVREHVSGTRPVIRHGGGGPLTAFVCGAFHFEDRDDHPLLGVLPRLIHVAGRESRTPPWLESTLRFLSDELRRGDPGSETIVARLIDIIFVQTIRAWMEQAPAAQGGWLAALRDPQIGRALGLMHRSPELPWTVSSLGSELAMSRSGFAARFTQLVGESPMLHLFRWRMWLAADLLRRGNLAIADVATRIGYDSEMAFSKAFKRHFGVPPGVYRRQAHTAA
jgi:AraC-like DNA-binding protein